MFIKIIAIFWSLEQSAPIFVTESLEVKFPKYVPDGHGWDLIFTPSETLTAEVNEETGEVHLVEVKKE